MSASVQKATQFFFDRFGHLIADGVSNLPQHVEPRAEVTCRFCGRHGVGVWDGRGNQMAYLCLPCWSFCQPAKKYFVVSGNNINFSDKVRAQWVADDHGVTVYVSQKTLDTKEPDKRAMPGFRYVVDTKPILDMLSGNIKPPFLWGLFGAKREQAMETLELTESLSRIVFCDGTNGKRVYYDIKHMQMAIASIEPLSEEHRKDPWFRRWIRGDDITGTVIRLDVKKNLRRLGLDQNLLRLSLGERAAVRDVLSNIVKDDSLPPNSRTTTGCGGAAVL